MTSSLVGSEMCIRDSQQYTRTFLHAEQSPLRHAARPAFGAGSPPWHSVAVSYTHLTLPTICSV
eukprot:9561181-Prorocentrum_lima.AAC.1